MWRFGHHCGQGYGYGHPYGHDPGWSGRGFGRGQGWCHYPGSFNLPEDYEYLGPCRCGFGPDAFYRDKKTGRIFRGFPPYFWGRPSSSEESLKEELEALRKEKEELEKRIAEIEKELFKKEE